MGFNNYLDKRRMLRQESPKERLSFKNKWTLRREALEAEEEAERQSFLSVSLPRLKFLQKDTED